METAANRLSLYFEAAFGVLVEDLLGKFMYISQFRRYAQLSSGTRDILLLPPLHTRQPQ